MNMMKARLALLILASMAVMAGCASTESLYAQYDELCPVEARVTSNGLVTVTGIAAGGGAGLMAGESRTQVWEPAVYFGFDQSQMAEAEVRRLDSNLAVLKQYPTLQVSVQAFTDEKGAASYNQKLAARRLDQVVQYLRDGGISNGRIKRVALGEELPILSNASNEQRVINRRVELMPLDAQSRPLVLRADFAGSGGDEFVPPAPVK